MMAASAITLRVLRVGYDTTATTLNRAGEARYVRDLLGALRQLDDLDVRVLAPTRRVPGGGLQRIALQAAIQGLYQPWVLPGRARAQGVDVLHLTRPLVAPMPRLSTPTVVTVHDVLPLRAPEYFSKVIRANFRALAPRTIRAADAVLAVSEYCRGEVVELLGVDPGRVHVVPEGVDERFRPMPRPDHLAERFGIDRPYVLCVGTMEIRKNLPAALRAFAALGSGRSEFQLVVTGGQGWMNAEFGSVLDQLRDDIVVTGYVSDDDLVALLSSAACFVYPSFLEGFGLPPLEAMASGTPVVTSNVSSLPEVVGDAAILVDPREPTAIAHGLRRALLDPALREQMRQRGLARAHHYSWERTTQTILRIYRETAAGR
jgi:glycosyltransferase involved in cell wall biosynthesis